MQVSKSYARPHLSNYKASRVNLVKNKRNYYAFHADTDLRQRNFIRTEHSHRLHTIEAFFFLNCAFFSIEQELRKRQTIKFYFFLSWFELIRRVCSSPRHTPRFYRKQKKMILEVSKLYKLSLYLRVFINHYFLLYLE